MRENINLADLQNRKNNKCSHRRKKTHCIAKYRKHKKTRTKKINHQKGGGILDYLGLSNSSEQSMMSSQPTNNSDFSITNTTNSLISNAEGYLQQLKDKSSNWFVNPFSNREKAETQQTIYTQESIIGGKRKNKSKKLRGGKGNLGLTYYATPVSGIKVANPTYWIKGGSKTINKKEQKKRKIKKQIKRGGERRNEELYLSPEDVELLKSVIRQNYGDSEYIELVFSAIPNMKFDPDYTNPFTGEKFEGDDKKYFQAYSRIESYFKDGAGDISELIDEE